MPGVFVNKLSLCRLPAHNAVLASEGSAAERYGKGLMDEEGGRKEGPVAKDRLTSD